MLVSALVAANGLGHYRRTLSVLFELRRRQSGLQVHVLCPQWQIDAMMNWRLSQEFWSQKNTFHVDGVAQSGVVWSPAVGSYSNGCLISWEDQLHEITALKRADIILSDNLTGILTYRPDAILLGSFLWSDVLGEAYPNNPDVAQFVDHERGLLRQHAPNMICVGDAVMPGVVAQTKSVPVGWMCENVDNSEPSDDEGSDTIAVIGSASGHASDRLVTVIKALLEVGKWRIAITERLAKAGRFELNDRVRRFGFTQEDFRSCQAIICRPGMGIVTDCVAYGVPIISVHEVNNLEMVHIGNRIADLGIGWNISVDDSCESDDISDAIQNILENEDLMAARWRMSQLDRNGLQQAADWILQRLIS